MSVLFETGTKEEAFNNLPLLIRKKVAVSATNLEMIFTEEDIFVGQKINETIVNGILLETGVYVTHTSLKKINVDDKNFARISGNGNSFVSKTSQEFYSISDDTVTEIVGPISKFTNDSSNNEIISILTVQKYIDTPDGEENKGIVTTEKKEIFVTRYK